MGLPGVNSPPVSGIISPYNWWWGPSWELWLGSLDFIDGFSQQIMEWPSQVSHLWDFDEQLYSMFGRIFLLLSTFWSDFFLWKNKLFFSINFYCTPKKATGKQVWKLRSFNYMHLTPLVKFTDKFSSSQLTGDIMAFAVHVRISFLCSGDVSALHRGRTWELDGRTWSVFFYPKTYAICKVSCWETCLHIFWYLKNPPGK